MANKHVGSLYIKWTEAKLSSIGPQFSAECGICPFSWNFYIFAEFSTGRWQEHKYAIFCSVSGGHR